MRKKKKRLVACRGTKIVLAQNGHSRTWRLCRETRLLCVERQVSLSQILSFLHSTESAFAPLYWGDGGYFLEKSSKSNISVCNFNAVGFSAERVAESKCCVVDWEPRRCATPYAKVLGPNLRADPRPSWVASCSLAPWLTCAWHGNSVVCGAGEALKV